MSMDEIRDQALEDKRKAIELTSTNENTEGFKLHN